jgi:hypothetical protein
MAQAIKNLIAGLPGAEPKTSAPETLRLDRGASMQYSLPAGILAAFGIFFQKTKRAT